MAVVTSYPRNATPEFADAIEVSQVKAAQRLRVAMPAKVERVLGPQFIDVKPLLQQHAAGAAIDYPVIPGVLVCMPVGGGNRMTWALAPGDTGLLIVCDRSIENYAGSDGVHPVDPADARCHHLTDAVFLPGLVPHAKQTEQTDDTVLANGQATLRLQKDGKLTFGNGTDEMMKLLVQMAGQLKTLADDLSSSSVLTAMGPASFLASSIARFQSVSATMQDVTTRLTTLQGGT